MRYFTLIILSITFVYTSVGQRKKQVDFGIGGNLNLLDESFVNGLYYDLTYFEPSVYDKLGVDVRISQGKLIGDSTSREGRTNYFLLDSINSIEQQFRTITKTENNFLILNLNPTYKLTDEIYVLAFFEYFKKTAITESRVEIVSQDTIITNGFSNSSSLVSERLRETKIGTNIFEWAIGTKLYLDATDNIIVNIRPVLGCAISSTSGRQDFGLFYHTHFEAIEVDHGFKFGGELRGLTRFKRSRRNKVSRSNIDSFRPFVNLYVSKTFGLKKLGNLVFGGD